MNAWGYIGCLRNRHTIYGWLKKEASNRSVEIDDAKLWPILKAGLREWWKKSKTR